MKGTRPNMGRSKVLPGSDLGFDSGVSPGALPPSDTDPDDQPQTPRDLARTKASKNRGELGIFTTVVIVTVRELGGTSSCGWNLTSSRTRWRDSAVGVCPDPH